MPSISKISITFLCLFLIRYVSVGQDVITYRVLSIEKSNDSKSWKEIPFADVGFMFIAYNLRRLMNIVDKTLLTKFLQELVLSFLEILTSIKAIIFKIRPVIFYTTPSQNILTVS